MKLIRESKAVDFTEEINVSMSIKELLTIYGALAICETRQVSEWMESFQELKALAKDINENDLTYEVYQQTLKILNEKGIQL